MPIVRLNACVRLDFNVRCVVLDSFENNGRKSYYAELFGSSQYTRCHCWFRTVFLSDLVLCVYDTSYHSVYTRACVFVECNTVTRRKFKRIFHFGRIGTNKLQYLSVLCFFKSINRFFFERARVIRTHRQYIQVKRVLVRSYISAGVVYSSRLFDNTNAPSALDFNYSTAVCILLYLKQYLC